jgi:16S rRNA processing protein RimM
LSTSSSDLVSAGVVGRPHGLDGSFHVTRPRADVFEPGAQVTVGGERRSVDRRVGTHQRPIIRLSGASSRTDAEALRGAELLVERSMLPPLGDDEYWPEDLQGCTVVDGERTVGTVRRLLAYPSCELLEVAREGRGDLLVPLVRDAVRSVDVQARRVDVRLVFLGEE